MRRLDFSRTEAGPEVAPRLRLSDLRFPDVFVVVQALLLLSASQMTVRLAGLRRAGEWANRLTRTKLENSSVDLSASEVLRIALIARAASRRWPLWASCLDRAFVGLVLLGRRGVSVSLCIGFRRSPLGIEGHAWLEHNAVPLAETTNLKEVYSRRVLIHQVVTRPTTNAPA